MQHSTGEAWRTCVAGWRLVCWLDCNWPRLPNAENDIQILHNIFDNRNLQCRLASCIEIKSFQLENCPHISYCHVELSAVSIPCLPLGKYGRNIQNSISNDHSSHILSKTARCSSSSNTGPPSLRNTSFIPVPFCSSISVSLPLRLLTIRTSHGNSHVVFKIRHTKARVVLYNIPLQDPVVTTQTLW